MSRWLLFGCFVALAGCADLGPSRPALAFDHGVADPAGQTTMPRVTGRDATTQPLLPQPGNIWADVLPKPETAAAPDSMPPARTPAAARHAAAPVSGAKSPAVHATTPTGVATADHPVVQLAAGASAQQAVAAWRRLRLRAPQLTSGHSPAISAADVNGRQVWRLRADGFSDLAAARAFCSDLRASKADCWVVPAAALR